MSKATKRKHVVKEVEDFCVPTESQSIVRIVESRGNNLHEVIDPVGDRSVSRIDANEVQKKYLGEARRLCPGGTNTRRGQSKSRDS